MKNKFKITGAFLIGMMIMMSSIFTSCKDKNNPDDGKIDPGTIATSNLVAYFPFDGNATESIATITPTVQTGVTYVNGQRGQAYQGADLARLLYQLPAASKMKTLTSFTVALWFKSPLVTGDPEPIFFQVGKSDDLYWGNLTLALNRLDATADTLQFKAFFLKTGVQWSGQHVSYSDKAFVINTWMHMVFEYDAMTSKYKIFKNGIQVVTNEGVENRKSGEAGDPLGTLAFANADVINIGAWRPKSEGTAEDAWMGWFKGNLDELRVYDKALSTTEVEALFEAEVTQLDK
ncbi:MAG TPA: LamG-like jellyroll fold domain-containing protein [Bacteroidales bacterium]|nr:LamG-like jellyroll fold domain-containing protein [Bacteroidales bacterium]